MRFQSGINKPLCNTQNSAMKYEKVQQLYDITKSEEEAMSQVSTLPRQRSGFYSCIISY